MMLHRLGLLCSLMVTTLVMASPRRYQASLEDSQWSQEGDAMACRLIHPIPLLGQGVFELQASRQPQLQFQLHSRYRPDPLLPVDLRSIAGNWSPGDPSRVLMNPSGGLLMQEPVSRTLLTELEQGRFIRLFFKDANTHKDELDVALSPINFIKAYREFEDCSAKLLPFAFKDIERTPVLFDFDQHQLTDAARVQLDAIVRYINAQGSYQEIWIEGHTDSKGTDAYNDKLGELRAQSIQEALLKQGIPVEKLLIKSFGETRPARPNKTERGRAQNRRVEVRLISAQAAQSPSNDPGL